MPKLGLHWRLVDCCPAAVPDSLTGAMVAALLRSTIRQEAAIQRRPDPLKINFANRIGMQIAYKMADALARCDYHHA